jgi:hypothetical protein
MHLLLLLFDICIYNLINEKKISIIKLVLFLGNFYFYKYKYYS